jgi:hypothetical protein
VRTPGFRERQHFGDADSHVLLDRLSTSLAFDDADLGVEVEA